MNNENNTDSSMVAALTLGIFHLFGVGIESEAFGVHSSVSLSVLALAVEMHEDAQAQGHGDHSDKEAMTGEIPRCISGTEGKARNNTTKVAKADVHSNPNCSLGSATNVVSVPGDTQRNVGINSIHIVR